MRAILSERNLVVVLFIMVLITFAFAQEDSKKMVKQYIGTTSTTGTSFRSISKAGMKPASSGKKEILPVAIRR
jgi:hypothetical protein